MSILLNLIESHHLVKHDGWAETPQQLAVELEADRVDLCRIRLNLLFVALVN